MFTITQGLSIASLLTMFEMPIIFNAAAATAVMVGSLSFYAYNTPSTNFLNFDSYLLLGLASLLGVGVVNMFWPSPILMNLYLYGGLMLFGGFVLYDTQKIVHDASTKQTFDPMGQSIGIYLDSINIFIKFLMIFGKDSKK